MFCNGDQFLNFLLFRWAEEEGGRSKGPSKNNVQHFIFQYLEKVKKFPYVHIIIHNNHLGTRLRILKIQFRLEFLTSLAALESNSTSSTFSLEMVSG